MKKEKQYERNKKKKRRLVGRINGRIGWGRKIKMRNEEERGKEE